jgi:ADP-ribose pyrophosphatase
MGEPVTLTSRILFDHPYARIIVDLIEFEGRQQQYFYLTSPVEAVATVGVTGDGCLLLTQQYRHPVGKTIFDLPAGRLEPGEDPLSGARREFMEETGFNPGHIEPLGYYNQFPGMLRAGTHLFFARDLSLTAQRLDEGEFLMVIPMPVNEVVRRVLTGEFIDGSLQLGVMLALQKGLLPV